MIALEEDRPVNRARSPWVTTATRDAIRHFAWGIGDNNPLWLDPDYARQSPWGGLIAPPCFLYAVDETSMANGHPGRRIVYRAVDWTFFDMIRQGQTISATAYSTGETDIDGIPEQSGRVEFRTNSGMLLARAETICARPKDPLTDIDDRPEVRYSGDELDAIERTILAEQRRGNTRRNHEETAVGDTLGPLIKGPLSIMDVVAWCAATSGVVPEDAGFSEGGLHDQMATGPELVSWIAQLVTDWMGDDAFLHRLCVNIDACPTLGATTTITGNVTSVDDLEGRTSASIDLMASDQDGRTTAQGTALVLQPSTKHGPVVLPIEE